MTELRPSPLDTSLLAELPTIPAADDSVVFKVVSAEQAHRERKLVDDVVASFADAKSERVKQITQSLIQHLHSFVREVRLTPREWESGIEFLTAAGHITDDRRQEFVLLSDILGVSMQVIAVNNDEVGDATEAASVGPFFVENSPEIPLGGDLCAGSKGVPCWVEGVIRDVDGNPVPGARIEVWAADEDGLYDVQYGDGRVACRGHMFSDEDGSYRFWAATPPPYALPLDGPVGTILQAVGRSPMQAADLHFKVSAPGQDTLVTHILVEGCDFLSEDSDFGVEESLVRDFIAQPPGTPTPDGRVIEEGTWQRVRFDVVLAPAKQSSSPDALVVAVAKTFHT